MAFPELFQQITGPPAMMCAVKHRTKMHLFPTILLALVLLMIADALRWKVVVGRELRQRNLVRVRASAGARITPARGFRVIEICTCERDGKKCRVTILNRGWFRTRPSVEVVEL
jgi:hypothetical protein